MDFCDEICGEAVNSPKPHRPCGGHRAFAPALSIIHEAQYQENSWGKGPFTTAAGCPAQTRRGGGVRSL
jgi:hypothetical protein